jgi:hypothetical protein
MNDPFAYQNDLTNAASEMDGYFRGRAGALVEAQKGPLAEKAKALLKRGQDIAKAAQDTQSAIELSLGAPIGPVIVKNIVQPLINKVSEKLGGTKIGKAVQGGIDKIKTKISGTVENFRDLARQGEEGVQKAATSVRGAVDDAKSGVDGVVGDAKDSLEDAKGAITDSLDQENRLKLKGLEDEPGIELKSGLRNRGDDAGRDGQELDEGDAFQNIQPVVDEDRGELDGSEMKVGEGEGNIVEGDGFSSNAVRNSVNNTFDKMQNEGQFEDETKEESMFGEEKVEFEDPLKNPGADSVANNASSEISNVTDAESKASDNVANEGESSVQEAGIDGAADTAAEGADAGADIAADVGTDVAVEGTVEGTLGAVAAADAWNPVGWLVGAGLAIGGIVSAVGASNDDAGANQQQHLADAVQLPKSPAVNFAGKLVVPFRSAVSSE